MSLPPKSEIADTLGKAPVPVVFVDVHAASAGRLPRVIGDDTAGGALAAGHLLELGHRRIGFIGDLENDPLGSHQAPTARLASHKPYRMPASTFRRI